MVCSQQDLVLALGIISAPDYFGRRLAQRHSWMRWANVGQGDRHTVCASFVVRAGDPPRGVATALQREAEIHGDMLLVRSIAYNESRVRGPILSLAWWLQYAERALPHAKFIGKLDDDAYVHAPDLEQMLRLVHLQLGPAANVYLGVLTWYHWYPTLFDNTMHAWTFKQAIGVGRRCRSTDLHVQGCDDVGTAMAADANKSATGAGGSFGSTVRSGLGALLRHGTSPPALSAPSGAGCGTCRGPFAFAAGYLIVGSRALVQGMVAQGGIAADVARLRKIDATTMRNKQGRRAEMVMEDVWLGYILHAYPLKSPVRYVSLLGDRRSTLYVDAWDFRIARTAVLTHVITKQLERFLALHHYASHRTEGVHCSADAWRVRCLPYCGTRAATAHLPEWCTGHSAADAARAGPPRATGAGGAPLVDEWCTVFGVRNSDYAGGSQQDATPDRAACCGGPNASCTRLFGSNRWPNRFRPALKQMRRFESVEVAAANMAAALQQAAKAQAHGQASSNASGSLAGGSLARKQARQARRSIRLVKRIGPSPRSA